jgi:hypothetical protein
MHGLVGFLEKRIMQTICHNGLQAIVYQNGALRRPAEANGGIFFQIMPHEAPHAASVGRATFRINFLDDTPLAFPTEVDISSGI